MSPSARSRAFDLLRAALIDSRGGLGSIVALALPVLLTLILGAIDLMSVNGDRSKAQDVADGAALAAAKQLSLVDSQGVEERAQHYVRAELGDLKDRFTYSVTATAAENRSGVTVTIEGKRTSFFGNMLPPGGWPIRVTATAGAMGVVPLCVLTTGVAKENDLNMKDQAQITAGGCMVHSNGDIKVENTSWLQAGAVQAAGRATGRISPTPQQSGPTLEDPFAKIELKTPKTLCLPVDVILSLGLNTLPPGVHCGKYVAGKGAKLKLQPGDHYFIGTLELKEDAVLEGSNVVLVFDKDSDFKFKDKSQIDLVGRNSGPFAGFVLATTRKNTKTFEISSDSARQLLGTIYIPSATLEVTGKSNKIADQSPWTVIVARSIKLKENPILVINSKYAGSGVPVPNGVGPSTNQVSLTN